MQMNNAGIMIFCQNYMYCGTLFGFLSKRLAVTVRKICSATSLVVFHDKIEDSFTKRLQDYNNAKPCKITIIEMFLQGKSNGAW